MQRTILIQNYHPTGTAALIRDFRRIGFRVVSPDSDWGRIGYWAPNDGLGGELVTQEQYLAMPPGFLMVGCKAQEDDLVGIARAHGDELVLNIAQQHHVYAPGLSDVLICPDIALWRSYPDAVKHRLLYFPRPVLGAEPVKDLAASFASREVASYISVPTHWARGLPAFEAFCAAWDGPCHMFGHQAKDGMLSHEDTNRRMAAAFFTVHFKDDEAYGLSCIESMMLGTPVVSTHEFMAGKTLGDAFLRPDNAIVADTIEEAVARLQALTFDDYARMSGKARETVMDLTSDARTIDVLRDAMDDQIAHAA